MRIRYAIESKTRRLTTRCHIIIHTETISEAAGSQSSEEELL